MNNARRLSNYITRTVSGPMWHGPALSELLTDVSSMDAAMRPIGGAHSIWELVLHSAAWAEIARSRLGDTVTDTPSTDEDWPPMTSESRSDWQSALNRLYTSYRQLAEDVAMLDHDRLARLVPGQEYSVQEMLNGVIEHGAYHGGQIAILKRALTHVSANRVTAELPDQ